MLCNVEFMVLSIITNGRVFWVTVLETIWREIAKEAAIVELSCTLRISMVTGNWLPLTALVPAVTRTVKTTDVLAEKIRKNNLR